MSDAIGAAARHAYVGVRRKARATVSSSVEMDVSPPTPSTGDFDAEVEVWYR